MRFDTTAVHAGREDLAGLGVHAPPLDLSTTYPVPHLPAGGEGFASLVGGAAAAANPIHARLHNPTVARAEHAVAALARTEACGACGSGMAALNAVPTARRASGRDELAVA